MHIFKGKTNPEERDMSIKKAHHVCIIVLIIAHHLVMPLLTQAGLDSGKCNPCLSFINSDSCTPEDSMVFQWLTLVEQLHATQSKGFEKLQVLSDVLFGELERFFFHLTMTYIKSVAAQLEKS